MCKGETEKKKEEMTACLRSPSICHSDSDLSEGSRKYSPSSETSLETQRACGKAETCHFPHIHTHPVTLPSKKKCVTSSIKPSLTEIGDYSSGQTRPFTPIFFPFLSLQKEAAALIYVFPFFFLSLVLCLPPACLSQEASQRRTPLCATIMASAARRKCSG